MSLLKPSKCRTEDSNPLSEIIAISTSEFTSEEHPKAARLGIVFGRENDISITFVNVGYLLNVKYNISVHI